MNPEECRVHPLNNSKAKYAFKFGKSERFKTQRLYICILCRYTDKMYSTDQRPMTRTCSFGFGDRSPLGKKN